MSMMPISHRLFAAALRDSTDDRRPKPRVEKSVVIELPRDMEIPAWVAARQAATAQAQVWSARVGV